MGQSYQLKYVDPSGVVLHVQSEKGIPGIVEMTPYNTTIDWKESALVAFERGFVQLDLPAPLVINRAGKVIIFKDPDKDTVPQSIKPTLPWVHAMKQQAINFVRLCQGQILPPCDAAEALEDLHLCRQYIKIRYGQ